MRQWGSDTKLDVECAATKAGDAQTIVLAVAGGRVELPVVLCKHIWSSPNIRATTVDGASESIKAAEQSKECILERPDSLDGNRRDVCCNGAVREELGGHGTHTCKRNSTRPMAVSLGDGLVRSDAGASAPSADGSQRCGGWEFQICQDVPEAFRLCTAANVRNVFGNPLPLPVTIPSPSIYTVPHNQGRYLRAGRCDGVVDEYGHGEDTVEGGEGDGLCLKTRLS